MKKTKFGKNREEILYHLINAGIAGALVFVGAFSSGGITRQGFVLGLVTSIIVVISKFKTYWDSQEAEYKTPIGVFNFVP